MGTRTQWTGRVWRKTAVLPVLAVVASAAFVVVGAAPARADEVPCHELGDREWELVGGGHRTVYESYDYLSFISTPTFNVSDRRIAVNELDTPNSVTFTSEQSQTWSITVGASMEKSLTETLKLTVSADITHSRTTSIGVSVTATVPPRSTVLGEYGIQAFDVTFEARTYQKIIDFDGPTRQRCEDLGVSTHHVNAPTDREGWRTRLL